jgi:flagellar hook-associated protein 3 FlgL
MSTAFRITQRTVSSTMMQGLQGNLGKLQKLQEQLSSGRQVNRPSDSPVKTVEAMQFRSDIRRTEQHVRNASDGLAMLGTADAALTDSLKMTGRARELVLQGLNDANNVEGRKALATELRSLRDGLVAVANTRYLGRPIFGGNTVAPDAFDRQTGAYQGDQGLVERTIAPGTQVTVNVPGSVVFGADGDPAQLFKVLDDLAHALEEPDPAGRHAALNGGLVNLDKAVDTIVNTLGEIGARFNRVETMRSTAEGQLIKMAASLSEVENIDLPRTIVDLQLQEVAYKAALGATARVVQPSLLDFLR